MTAPARWIEGGWAMDAADLPGRFAGKVAVVTGASAVPSIGFSCASRLALEGASVVLNGRDPGALGAAADRLATDGHGVVGVAGSVEDGATVAALVGAAIDRFGRIDLLVNTVGGARFRGSFDAMHEDDLLGTVALNTWPTVALIQESLRHGLADGGGAVVNISSGSPRKTTSTMVAYAAAKACLNALTRTIAADLAPRGVRVNAVCPGLTATTGTRSTWEDDGGQAAGAHLPVGRLTGADDIAAAATFLLSDDARQITGVLLDVDGGNHLASGGWTPIGDPRLSAGPTGQPVVP